jgi:hypothetical protein
MASLETHSSDASASIEKTESKHILAEPRIDASFALQMGGLLATTLTNFVEHHPLLSHLSSTYGMHNEQSIVLVRHTDPKVVQHIAWSFPCEHRAYSSQTSLHFS